MTTPLTLTSKQLFVLLVILLIAVPSLTIFVFRYQAPPKQTIEHEGIDYHYECGKSTPLRVQIPALTGTEVFSCDVIADRTLYHQIVLEYPFDTTQSRQELWDMLGGSVYSQTTSNGDVFINDSPGDISYSIYSNGQKLFGKDKVFPKISFYSACCLDTVLYGISMKKGQRYTINISGIPERYRAYQGVYLVVLKRIY